VGIADGDTISVMWQGKPQKIRLYGVDCPESRQEFGTRARQFTAGLVYRKTVRVTPFEQDRYGRTVAMVEVDGVSLNQALLAEGLAWVYDRYCQVPECSVWQEIQEEARQERRGLWVDPNPVPPWDWRRGGEKREKAPATPRSPATGPYHGNSKSRVFHQENCPYFNCANCRVVFASRNSAIADGYRPCPRCKP
jgi:endonuclease YncB( thermonuclease family)